MSSLRRAFYWFAVLLIVAGFVVSIPPLMGIGIAIMLGLALSSYLDREGPPESSSYPPPVGTTAPLIFRALLAAGATLLVSLVLCFLCTMADLLLRSSETRYLSHLCDFLLHTTYWTALPIFGLMLWFQIGDFSDEPQLQRRGKIGRAHV